MPEQMDPQRVKALLLELRVDLGFCLPAESQRRLESAPPIDVDEFTDQVFREEGMDPLAARNTILRQKVRGRVAKHLDELSRDIEQKK